MKKLTFLLVLLSAAWLLGACGVTSDFDTQQQLRPATDTPEQFIPETGIQLDDSSCKSPLVDPRDATKITMVRSSSTMADYQVPAGAYGVGKRELLRLNCASGEVLGIVKR